MKILFFGDSITDASRNRERPEQIDGLGGGYVRIVADRLYSTNPNKYEIINTGISGNRIVDLYQRIKKDFWNYKPDVLNILIGVNDVWHEIDHANGVELDRFEQVYRMLIKDTLKVLPNVKIFLMEPFLLEGWATINTEVMPDRYSRFENVYEYAKVVKKLADEFNLPFIALQEKLSKKASEVGAKHVLIDGVHPNFLGASIIADAFIEKFKENINK